MPSIISATFLLNPQDGESENKFFPLNISLTVLESSSDNVWVMSASPYLNTATISPCPISTVAQEENEKILLLQTYHYINNALYHKALGNVSKALLIFEQCLKVLNPEVRHKFLISHYMKDIYSKLHDNIPQDVTKGCEIITHPFMSLCAENDMFFATMRFYE